MLPLAALNGPCSQLLDGGPWRRWGFGPGMARAELPESNRLRSRFSCALTFSWASYFLLPEVWFLTSEKETLTLLQRVCFKCLETAAQNVLFWSLCNEYLPFPFCTSPLFAGERRMHLIKK